MEAVDGGPVGHVKKALGFLPGDTSSQGLAVFKRTVHTTLWTMHGKLQKGGTGDRKLT